MDLWGLLTSQFSQPESYRFSERLYTNNKIGGKQHPISNSASHMHVHMQSPKQTTDRDRQTHIDR